MRDIHQSCRAMNLLAQYHGETRFNANIERGSIVSNIDVVTDPRHRADISLAEKIAHFVVMSPTSSEVKELLKWGYICGNNTYGINKYEMKRLTSVVAIMRERNNLIWISSGQSIDF